MDFKKFDNEIKKIKRDINKKNKYRKSKDIWDPSDYWYPIARKINSTNYKGTVGEKIFLSMLGEEVSAKRSSTEHDLVVKNLKLEIKLSCVCMYDLQLKYMHIRPHCDWDILVMIGLYPKKSAFPNAMKVWVATKEEISKSDKIRALKDKELRLEFSAYNIPVWMEPFEKKALDEFGVSEIYPLEKNPP